MDMIQTNNFALYIKVLDLILVGVPLLGRIVITKWDAGTFGRNTNPTTSINRLFFYWIQLQ